MLQESQHEDQLEPNQLVVNPKPPKVHHHSKSKDCCCLLLLLSSMLHAICFACPAALSSSCYSQLNGYLTLCVDIVCYLFRPSPAATAISASATLPTTRRPARRSSSSPALSADVLVIYSRDQPLKPAEEMEIQNQIIW